MPTLAGNPPTEGEKLAKNMDDHTPPKELEHLLYALCTSLHFILTIT